MEKQELSRQIIHIFAGLGFMIILAYLGRINLIAISLIFLFIGSILINFKLIGLYVPIAHDIGDSLERKKVKFPGWGPAWYVLGIILLATVLTEDNKIMTGVFILAVPDGVATIVGMQGTHKLLYNNKKTVEGTAVFFISSLMGYLFIGMKIIPLAIITTIVESLKVPIDDNFSLPLLCMIYLFLF